jgi:malate synthase
LNNLDGQVNLRDAIRRQIAFKDAKTGKEYKLNEKTATLLVRYAAQVVIDVLLPD